MSSKLNVETFVAVLKKSGLIEADRLQRLVTDYTAKGGSPDDSPKLADFLVANGAITRWQSEKLLQGKHKGYFLGKYRLLSLLGKGGMSSVYLAEHVLMRRRCALKVLPTKRVNDSSYLARFHREAQAVASLDHPNIVRAYDVDHQVDRDSEIHFLVMEYVEGYSLQELVQKQGVCGFCDAAEYIRQAALGLDHAHEAGMVHRDVKPGNLLVDPNGVVKVLDLGLARFFTGDETEDALTLRHDEKVLGTADYLAPEQALDSHMVDARADIYSLGCTMYFLLTGRPPFTDGTLTQRLMAHQTKTPPTIESLRPETPATLTAIVRKMMAKKAEERYATAKEAADALYHWIDTYADQEWRKAHSGIFGNRIVTESSSIPIAQPIMAMPVATPVLPVATPIAKPPTPVVPPAPVAPATPEFQFAAPPEPTSEPAAVDNELSSFFATLSDSQKSPGKSGSTPSIAKPASPTAPKAPTPVPPQSTIITAPAPPHLKPASSMKLKQPAVTPAQATASGAPFLGFGANSPSQATPAHANKSSAVPTVPAASAGKSNLFRKLPWPLPVPVLAGIGGGLVLLALIAFYWMGGLGGGKGSAQSQLASNLPPWPDEKREVTVGEGGEFKSIVDALRVVRRRFQPTGASNDQMVIKIAAGTYRENISVDGTVRPTSRKSKKADKPTEPDWPLGIKLVADGEVILEAPRDVPAIRLTNLSKFIIEGITINAADKAVGIEINGDVSETRLSGMTITGFKQTGVLCQGARGIAFGNSQLILEKLTLEPSPEAAASVGIRMQSNSDGDSSESVIRNCRFLGPMSAGVAISGTGPYQISIVENTFSKCQEGIRFEGAVQWRDITVTNNTFHEGRNGFVFTNMPSDQSRGLTFRRNLFSKMTGAEGLVQGGYDEGKFAEMTRERPMEFNYSDRPQPSSPLAGEINGLCQVNGKRGEQGFAFASTDPKSAKFLAPSEKSVQRSVPGAQDGEKAWIGAVER